MNLFVKKTLVFLVIVLLMLIISFVSLAGLVKNGNDYRLSENIHSVILGHSHSACSFNDEVIAGFYNLSQFTEGYPYSYFKAKVLLENNSHIKNIFVEYTNNQIGYWAKERIFGSYMSINMERMLPFLDKSFILKTFYASKSVSETSSSLIKSYKKNLDFVFSNRTNFIEKNWHNHKAPDHKFNADTAVKLQNKNNFVNFLDLQEENIRYLFNLKKLCEKHNVNLFLVRSPLPKYIRDGNINEGFFRLIRETYFSDVPFLDFGDYPLSIEYFADNSHLNVQGSKKFSQFFNDSVVKQVSFSDKEVESTVKDILKRIKNEN